MKIQKIPSTYTMLLRSDENERSVSETIVYLLLIGTMAFSIWQAANVRVTVPDRFRTTASARVIEVPARGV